MERGRECSTGSVFGNHGVYLREDERNSSKHRERRGAIREEHRRLLFNEVAEDYYHGFKLMSDYLHGWADRKNERRTLVEGQGPTRNILPW